MPEDIKEIILGIGAQIIKLAGEGDNLEENRNKILENINNGRAYTKFLELVQIQGGDISYIENPEKFQKARYIIPVYSEEEGYVEELNAEKVGVTSVHLGAGRVKKEDGIDHSVGMWLEKKVGDRVNKGDILAYIHANDTEKGNTAVKDLKQAYKIIKNPIQMEN